MQFRKSIYETSFESTHNVTDCLGPAVLGRVTELHTGGNTTIQLAGWQTGELEECNWLFRSRAYLNMAIPPQAVG